MRVSVYARVRSGDYWQCDTCRLCFLDRAQLVGPGEERREYSLHQNDPADEGYRRFLGKLTRHLVPLLSVGARGLDYGCGPGPALSAMLAEQGFRVVDYDPIFQPNPAALEQRYQFVTCTEVVEHFHQPGRDFDRLAALLEPGGWLGVMTQMHDPEADFSRWHYHNDPTHVSFYQQATMQWIADRYGWHVEFPERSIALFHKR